MGAYISESRRGCFHLMTNEISMKAEQKKKERKKERRVCSKCKSRIPLFASFPHREATRLKESSPATISKSAQIFTIRRSRLSVRLPCHVSFPFREESAYFIPRGVQTVFSASTSLRAPRLLSVPQFSTSPLQRLESPTIGKSRASFHSIISINASNQDRTRSRKLKKKSLANGSLDLILPILSYTLDRIDAQIRMFFFLERCESVFSLLCILHL